VADSGLGGSGPDRAWPPPGPRRRAPHRGLAIAAAVVAVAAAMVASVAVISAVHSTKTTPATSPLAALVDPGLVDVTATLGYQHTGTLIKRLVSEFCRWPEQGLPTELPVGQLLAVSGAGVGGDGDRGLAA